MTSVSLLRSWWLLPAKILHLLGNRHYGTRLPTMAQMFILVTPSVCFA